MSIQSFWVKLKSLQYAQIIEIIIQKMDNILIEYHKLLTKVY
jgi:hypothetical protein